MPSFRHSSPRSAPQHRLRLWRASQLTDESNRCMIINRCLKSHFPTSCCRASGCAPILFCLVAEGGGGGAFGVVSPHTDCCGRGSSWDEVRKRYRTTNSMSRHPPAFDPEPVLDRQAGITLVKSRVSPVMARKSSHRSPGIRKIHKPNESVGQDFGCVWG